MIRNAGLEVMNIKKVRRLKREYGLFTKIRRRNPYKHLPGSENATVANVLKRDFLAPLPDLVYSTDMTYLYYGSGQRAYLSATKDLATNEIVSHRLMRTPSVASFTDEFKTLLESLPQATRQSLVIHSDQGFQYTHQAYRDLLASYEVTQSMSRKANCIDNAPIETFFGHLKDLLELKSCRTFEDVEVEVKTVMDYYNYERPQAALNKKPPALYRGLLCGLF